MGHCEAAIHLRAPVLPANAFIAEALLYPEFSRPRYAGYPSVPATVDAQVMDEMIDRLRKLIPDDELNDVLHAELTLKDLYPDDEADAQQVRPDWDTMFIMIGKNTSAQTILGLQVRKVNLGSNSEEIEGERITYERIGYVHFYHRMMVDEILMRGLTGGYEKRQQLFNCIFERMPSALNRLQRKSITIV